MNGDKAQESKIITDEIIVKVLKDFKERYNAIEKDIRYVKDGHNLSLNEFVSEIENNTEIGRQFKETLVHMTLLSFFEFFTEE